MIWSPVSLELVLQMRTVHADSRNQKSTLLPVLSKSRQPAPLPTPPWHSMWFQFSLPSSPVGTHVRETDESQNLTFTISLRHRLVLSAAWWSHCPSPCLPKVYYLSPKSSLCSHQATPTLKRVSLNWNKNLPIGLRKMHQMPTLWLMLIAFL